jgi:hypothetical protein
MLKSTSSSSESKAAVLTALRAEKERRRRSQVSRFTKYRDDPVGFVENALLGFLWSKQKEICLSVRDNRRTAVQACHDVGKTALAARIGAWWLSVWEPGEAFLVTLAPTGHQVKALLWRELNRVHAAGGLPGRMNMIEWWIDSEMVGFGRSPADTDPTAIQGIHARRVLVINDEACGIGKALWDAEDSLIANDDSRILAIGNPDDPSTEFATVCKPGSGWNTIKINAFVSPNFTDEPVPDWLRPLLISRTWVEEKRKSWGEQSPLWKSKVEGEFPEQSTDSLVPLRALQGALTAEIEPGEPNELGVDVARFGDDSSVIYHRRGAVARRISKENKRDLMHLAGVVVNAIKETGATAVKIDDIGLGGGLTDRLRELKMEGKIAANVEIVPINVGEAPATNLMDERFRNLRAELNWGMRTRFVDGKIKLLGDCDDLLSEAGQIKYKFTSSGEIQIEAKAEMKKRTKGASPDDWDALVLCFAKPQFPGAGILEHYRRESEKVTASREAAVVAKMPPTTANGGVRMQAPKGISTAYGMDGSQYNADAFGIMTVKPADVGPLRAAGFVSLPVAESTAA